MVLTRKGIDAMCKAYKKGRRKRRDAGDDEAETSADESRAEPGTGEPEKTASAAEGTLGRGTRRAATSTDYGGPVARRRRAEDGEAQQTRRAFHCMRHHTRQTKNLSPSSLSRVFCRARI